ncbi:MAG: 15,15' beta carotene dioxygenase [Candidatus Xenobia bacterium]
MRPGYASGFETMRSLVNDRPLEVTGQLPEWLQGTLIRNGPGIFEAGPDRLRHWFDGLAVLHQFELGQGRVHYRSQPLQSPDFLEARRRGRIYYSNFATDPCVAKFRRLFSAFFPRLELGANANVSVTRLGERFLALTETPMAVEFDPRTLSTLGVVRYQDPMADNLTTAHPHRDTNRGSLINVTLEFGPRSTFRLTELLPGATRRQVLGAFPVERPSYLHSFGMAENWFILTLGALVVDPRKLLLRRRPFIENYRFEPERGTTWALYDRRTSRFQSLQSDALFTFHHVNAFEQGSDLVVDLITYPDATVVDSVYLDALARAEEVPGGQLRRFRLGSTVRSELLTDLSLELPRIHPARLGRPYRYVYGMSQRPGTSRDFFNMLARIDVTGGPELTWSEPGVYPGEPVFVPRPEGTAEDDGVVLCVLLEGSSSSLLVLDASNFRELARARVELAIPFGFHGSFYTL